MKTEDCVRMFLISVCVLVFSNEVCVVEIWSTFVFVLYRFKVALKKTEL